MRGSRLHGNDGGVARRGETLKPSHLVSFRLIPLVDRGWGFTLILVSKGPGMRGSRLHGNDGGVGGATAGTESLGRDRLRWCTLATPGIGPGRSRPRHACRSPWGRGSVACVSGLHAPRDGTGVLLQHWNHRTRSAAYSQLVVVVVLSFAVCGVRGYGVGAGGWDRDALGASSGVSRSGETLNSLPFPTISFHSHRRRRRWERVRGSAFAGGDGPLRTTVAVSWLWRKGQLSLVWGGGGGGVGG